ncbi:hypothetical protein ACWD6I_17720 [Streptomyces sp. NPDC002454]
MPTPNGTCGGMAFGAEELRVLRRALALVVHPRPLTAADVRDCLRLAESVDEALHEGARRRAFLVADLDRYRSALPGTARGYLALLEEALAAGHRPGPDDLAALRALRGNPTAAALLDRCRPPVDRVVRARPAERVPVPAGSGARAVAASPRLRLTALPGGLVAPRSGDEQPPPERPEPAPRERPAAPHRPVPTPAEVFPPRRRPAPPAEPRQPDAPAPAPPADPPQQRAAG